jgi:hypothetical protein
MEGLSFVRYDERFEFLMTISIKLVPYHPQSNGVVERRNAAVIKHLRLQYLPLVQHIMNETVWTDRMI